MRASETVRPGNTASTPMKQPTVVEMLEYVRGLNIDPVKESEMLWIAEEAFNAPLPPGWTQHQDDQARVYFYNAATGESTWRHPMDDLFREIVGYQRRVMATGGFWQIEDEIVELEESIRRDLADWMELFDEHGEKFFYNRRTDESRFDDPRMVVYHGLYARIKMVAKMKERLPLLARAPRPEEPTPQELEMKRRQQDAELRYQHSILRIQSIARVFLAKRKVKIKLAQATVLKGPQPLKGRLRLRLQKLGPGGARELVLSQTTPHKRYRAATKIQARIRGILARKRFRPLVMHRAYLSKVLLPVQTRARVWLARRKVARLRVLRKFKAAVDIQRVFRGSMDRQYVGALKAEKTRFEWILRCITIIQSGVRMMWAKRRVAQVRIEVNARRAAEAAHKAMLAARATRIQALQRGIMGRQRFRRIVQEVMRKKEAQEREWMEKEERDLRQFYAWEAEQIRVRLMEEAERQRQREMLELACMVAEEEHLRLFYAWEAAVKAKALEEENQRLRVELSVKEKELQQLLELEAAHQFQDVSCQVSEAPSRASRPPSKVPSGVGADVLAAAAALASLPLPAQEPPSSAKAKADEKPHTPATAKAALAKAPPRTPSTHAEPATTPTTLAAPSPASPPASASAKAKPGKPPSGRTSAQAKASSQPASALPSSPAAAAAPAAPEAPAPAAAPVAAAAAVPEAAVPDSTTAPVSPAGAVPKAPMEATAVVSPVTVPKTAPEPASTVVSVCPTPAPAREELAALVTDIAVAVHAPQGGSEQPAYDQSEQLVALSQDVRDSEDAGPLLVEEVDPPPQVVEAAEAPTLKDIKGSDISPKSGASPKSERAPKSARQPFSARLPLTEEQLRLQEVLSGKTVDPDPAGAVTPNKRRTYCGTYVNGRFIKAHVDKIDDLSEADKQAILLDLEQERTRKIELLRTKQKEHQQRKLKEETSKHSKYQSQLTEAEQLEDIRRQQKVKELKKWLKRKEDEIRARRERDAEMMQLVLEKETNKSEAIKKVEQERLEQRERRLRLAERSKAKLEAQLLMSREGGGGIRALAAMSKGTTPSKPMAMPSPEWTGAQQAIPQKVVHRHIHHHVHYHEGAGSDYDSAGEDSAARGYTMLSHEERRQLELATEARIRSQMETGGQERLGLYPNAVRSSSVSDLRPKGYGSVDSGAETPVMHRSMSMGKLPALFDESGMQLSQTQQAWRSFQAPHTPLPFLEDAGKKRGLVNYSKNVERAIGSYADSGRPRFTKGAGIAPVPGY